MTYILTAQPNTILRDEDGLSKLWLWRNGPYEFWAFDNPFPCHSDGDPMTLGEPCGYALLKKSVNGRPDVMEEDVMRMMEKAKP